MSTHTSPPPELDPFETRLLAELRREVVLASADAPAGRRTRRRSLVVAAGVAATALVGVVLVPGLGTSTAYSVQEGNAGEVTVEVTRPEDAAGLERQLAEHGIPADIVYLEWPQQCAEDRYTEAPADRQSGMGMTVGQDLLRVTLPPGAVQDGDTFVLSLSYRTVPRTEDGFEFATGETSVSFGVASGPVAPCDPR
jgi:hypothetical protein